MSASKKDIAYGDGRLRRVRKDNLKTFGDIDDSVRQFFLTDCNGKKFRLVYYAGLQYGERNTIGCVELFIPASDSSCYRMMPRSRNSNVPKYEGSEIHDEEVIRILRKYDMLDKEDDGEKPVQFKRSHEMRINEIKYRLNDDRVLREYREQNPDDETEKMLNKFEGPCRIDFIGSVKYTKAQCHYCNSSICIAIPEIPLQPSETKFLYCENADCVVNREAPDIFDSEMHFLIDKPILNPESRRRISALTRAQEEMERESAERARAAARARRPSCPRCGVEMAHYYDMDDRYGGYQTKTTRYDYCNNSSCRGYQDRYNEKYDDWPGE